VLKPKLFKVEFNNDLELFRRIQRFEVKPRRSDRIKHMEEIKEDDEKRHTRRTFKEVHSNDEVNKNDDKDEKDDNNIIEENDNKNESDGNKNNEDNEDKNNKDEGEENINNNYKSNNSPVHDNKDNGNNNNNDMEQIMKFIMKIIIIK